MSVSNTQQSTTPSVVNAVNSGNAQKPQEQPTSAGIVSNGMSTIASTSSTKLGLDDAPSPEEMEEFLKIKSYVGEYMTWAQLEAYFGPAKGMQGSAPAQELPATEPESKKAE